MILKKQNPEFFFKTICATSNEFSPKRERFKSFERNQTITVISHDNRALNNKNQNRNPNLSRLAIYQTSRLSEKRVSDKRYLYAKSKNCLRKSLFDKTLEHSMSEKSNDGSLQSSSGRFKNRDSVKQKQKLNNDSIQLKDLSPNKQSTNANTKLNFNATVSKSPGLLDPNWIPLKVQESLLDLHYKLHLKPTLLQTSQISKSDSNLKSKSFKQVDHLNKSKKMLSLQNSQEKENSNNDNSNFTKLDAFKRNFLC